MIIEEKIVDFLNRNGIHAFTEENDEIGPEYAIVSKNDGGEENMLTQSQIFILCYSDSLYNASIFCEKVKKIMNNLESDWNITSCDLENSYPETNQVTKQYRYIAEYIIHYYA